MLHLDSKWLSEIFPTEERQHRVGDICLRTIRIDYEALHSVSSSGLIDLLLDRAKGMEVHHIQTRPSSMTLGEIVELIGNEIILLPDHFLVYD